jgi:hypothetical protein
VESANFLATWPMDEENPLLELATSSRYCDYINIYIYIYIYIYIHMYTWVYTNIDIYVYTFFTLISKGNFRKAINKQSNSP